MAKQSGVLIGFVCFKHGGARAIFKNELCAELIKQLHVQSYLLTQYRTM